MTRFIPTSARGPSRLGSLIPLLAALLLPVLAGAPHPHRAGSALGAPARAKDGVDRSQAEALSRIDFEIAPKRTVILIASL